MDPNPGASELDGSGDGNSRKFQEAFTVFADGIDKAIARLKSRPGLQDSSETALEAAVRAWRQLSEDADRPLIVPVMGQFNTGKSTFLNALLGEALLSTDVTPHTAAVTLLTYGPERRLRAFFPKRPPQSLPLESLQAMSAEGASELATLRDEASYTELALPHPLLKQITLVDTPGLNANDQHTRVTRDYMNRADAVIWLFRHDQAGTDIERDEIMKLPPGCRPYAVVNQIDLADPDEEPIDAVLENIGRRLGSSVHRLIGVSAKLALDARNGGGQAALVASRWPAFMELLNQDILPNAAERKVTRMLERVEAALDLVLDLTEPKRNESRDSSLKLRQENSGKQTIRRRIEALSRLRDAWAQSANLDCASVILSSPSLNDDVAGADSLNQRREMLIGALKARTAKCAQFLQAARRLKAGQKQLRAHIRAHELQVNEYSHSGLFGGPRLFGGMFDGGEGDRLKSEEARLNQEERDIPSALSLHEDELSLLNSGHRRDRQDCGEFVTEVHAAIVCGLDVLQHKLDLYGKAGRRALLSFVENQWVVTLMSDLACHAAPVLANGLRGVPNCSEEHKIAIAARLRRLQP